MVKKVHVWLPPKNPGTRVQKKDDGTKNGNEGTKQFKTERWYRKPEPRHIHQNHPFTKLPFCFLSLVATIHFSAFTCCFRKFWGRSFTLFLSATRTPNLQNHSYVHYSLSKFTGEWFTNHSNQIHIFTPITRMMATTICHYYGINSFFNFRDIEITYGTRNYFSQRPNSSEITVWKSFKFPVRITALKNNSKTISVM